jgi:hypothetical protein
MPDGSFETPAYRGGAGLIHFRSRRSEEYTLIGRSRQTTSRWRRRSCRLRIDLANIELLHAKLNTCAAPMKPRCPLPVVLSLQKSCPHCAHADRPQGMPGSDCSKILRIQFAGRIDIDTVHNGSGRRIMFQAKQMPDFVNPDRYGFVIREIGACPGINGNPSLEVHLSGSCARATIALLCSSTASVPSTMAMAQDVD